MSAQPVRLTMLNSMGGADFDSALDRHLALGITDLDLKDQVYGSWIQNLSVDHARIAKQQIDARRMSVYCFSTQLFVGPIEDGEFVIRDREIGALDNLLAVADILRPALIRLLAPQAVQPAGGESRIVSAARNAPWIFSLIGEAVDRIAAAGYGCTIENEIADSIVRTPGDALKLMQLIDRPKTCTYTWDVQNMWECGTFPTVDVYEQLRPIIGYFHVKGGRADSPGGALVWRSSLADATWPVADIVGRVIADGISPVICINPSHGRSAGDSHVDYTEADIAFLRQTFKEIA